MCWYCIELNSARRGEVWFMCLTEKIRMTALNGAF